MKFSKKILTRAWAIFRASKVGQAAVSWGAAIKAAFAAARFELRLAALKSGEAIRFAYYKADGTLREAAATAFPAGFAVKGTGSPTPAGNVLYFDAAAGAPRSFKIQNLL